MVVHEQHLVAIEVYGRFRLGRIQFGLQQANRMKCHLKLFMAHTFKDLFKGI